MSYRGHIRNGVVVLDEPAPLAEGATVEVVPVPQPDTIASLREGLLRFAGTAKGLPQDMAEHHDQHIHGAPQP